MNFEILKPCHFFLVILDVYWLQIGSILPPSFHVPSYIFNDVQIKKLLLTLW